MQYYTLLASTLLAMVMQVTAHVAQRGHTARNLAGRQSSSPACAGTPSSSTDTVDYTFSLAAYNTSGLPNANSTGVPLLTSSAGYTDGASTAFIATWYSWPEASAPTAWSLTNGTLLPAGFGGHDNAVNPGDPPIFTFISNYPPTAANLFCSVAHDADALPALAVNGNLEGWSLCEASSPSRNILVYEPVSGSDEYDASTCYAVRVHTVYVSS